MKVYVAGAISYNVDVARDNFKYYTGKLREKGHKVMTPFEIVSEDAEYNTQLIKTAQAMLSCECVAVIVNDALVRSFGTVKELGIAHDYGIPVYPIQEVIDGVISIPYQV